MSKAIDNAAGATREVVGRYESPEGTTGPRSAGGRLPGAALGEPGSGLGLVTAPATPDAERWQGWGTALKPAHEPIVVARKPLAGTVAGNVLAHGTGALNVDGCRIGDGGQGKWAEPRGGIWTTDSDATAALEANTSGRWPANVVLDERAAELLDEQTGESLHLAGNKGGTPRDLRSYSAGERGQTNRIDAMPASPLDEATGASRFFYCAKSSSAERNAGLDGFEARETHRYGAGIGGSETSRHVGAPDRNVHPTVKPIDLMRWLVRLVTPPGGVVLDPFAGSGTTGAAAVLEGFRFVGIEREAEYAAIARARIEWWSQHPDGVEIVKALEAERERGKVRDAGQLGLFG